MPQRRSFILFIIVIAQFACVSLWFAGNGVMDDLIHAFNLRDSSLGNLTSAVQFGFIIGTLLFAFYSIADRISPSKVFLISAFIASASNLLIIFSNGFLPLIYGSRFLTGFFLAGVYPVGMKIAADYYDKDLGKALGYLLGALVIGTAFPHLLRSVLNRLHWENVLMGTSLMAIIGGIIVYSFVPDGPFRIKASGFDKSIIPKIFNGKNFRAAAFGYFGHMWELYAFWTFVPVIIARAFNIQNLNSYDISLLTFIVIGAGSVSCILGGYIAQKIGSYNVAFMALALSGVCCLISPLMFTTIPSMIYIFLLFWGMVVIMDSPQFSTLIAQTAISESKASSLTIVNCIGFSITIFSIQLLNILSGYISYQWLFIFLMPGPVFGLMALAGMRGTLNKIPGESPNLQKSIP